ncbi:Metalloproteinase inhibitor 1 [Stylophora pistillata]|uniref:Metalloproteinase inhibitor 1 n=1 Tax=Stylophora pistillata TaxID=50429 RepID=A0A2B4SZQ0_STYPI|nr:Metalloproteinase inhibitor 1 [Stylophora pistillata]
MFTGSQLEHPQLAFCKADFVIRAHIESGPITEGNYFVFKITIKEVFKGLSLGRQGKAFGLLDAEFKTKLYSPDGNASDKVTGVFGIRAGIEYLLFGDILHGGRLFTKFSFLREEWNKTTPRKRANLRGYYEAGCRQCQFRQCGESDLECRKKLPGCEKRATQTPYLYQWTPQSSRYDDNDDYGNDDDDVGDTDDDDGDDDGGGDNDDDDDGDGDGDGDGDDDDDNNDDEKKRKRLENFHNITRLSCKLAKKSTKGYYKVSPSQRRRKETRKATT